MYEETLMKSAQFNEFDENEKREYIIFVEKVNDENIVEKLTITTTRYPRWPNANRHGREITIDFCGNVLKVTTREFAYCWGGDYVKTIVEITIKTDFEELPWFCDYIDLEKTVSDFGVRRTIALILDYISDISDLISGGDWDEVQ